MAVLELIIRSNRATQGARQFQQATHQVDRSARQAAKGVDTYSRSVRRSSTAMSTARMGLSQLLGGFTAFLAIRASLSLLADFEQTISILGNVSQATSEEFLRLEDTARRFGATTRFTAREAGEGLLFLARTGFSANEAIQALPATLHLSQAGLISVAEASDQASNVLRQFNLATTETVRVADTMVMTANSSNTTVHELAQAFKFAGTLAGQMGVQVEELAAAVGLLGDAGVKATLAGTNLRGVFLNLMDPTPEAVRTLKGLGLSVNDINLEGQSLIEVFAKLREAGMGTVEAVRIFDRRSTAAALVLSRYNERLQELTARNKAAAGTAAEAAKVMDDTLVGAWKALLSAIQEVVLWIGMDSPFGQALKTVIFTMADAIRLLVVGEDAVRNMTPAVVVFAKGITYLGSALGVILALNVAVWFVKITWALVANQIVVGALTLAYKGLAFAFSLAAGAALPLLKTVGALGLALAAAFSMFNVGKALQDQYLWIQKSMDWIINLVSSLFIDIKFSFKMVMAELQGIFEETVGAMFSFFEGAIEKGMTSSNQFIRNFSLGLHAVNQGLQAMDGGVEKTAIRVGELALEWEKASQKQAEIYASVRAATISGFDPAPSFMEGLTGNVTEQLEAVKGTLDKFFADLGIIIPVGLHDIKQMSIEEIRMAIADLNAFFGGELLKTLEDKGNMIEDETKRIMDDIRKALAEIEAEIAALLDRPKKFDVIGFFFGDDSEIRLTQFGNRFNAILTDFSMTMIRTSESFSKSVDNMINSIIDLILQMIIAKTLAAALQGLFPWMSSTTTTTPTVNVGNQNALGGVHKFGSGGMLLNRPTLFPAANGFAMGGEAGPEFMTFLPLSRRKNGKLGFELEEGISRGRSQVIVNNHVSVYANNPDEFAGSERQIGQKMNQWATAAGNRIG